MKSYKITLFLFIVIALLGSVAYFFPPDGMQVGALHLKFPPISDFLVPKDTVEVEIPEISPEELLAQQLAEMHNEEDARHRAFFRSSAARIHFPNDSIVLFDSFFAALDSAKSTPMRILHYGDSQIEEDRITRTLRDELQHQFGGSGVGYIPIIQTVPTFSLRQSASSDLQRYLIYGQKSYRATHSRYGIAGNYAQLENDFSMSITGLKQKGMHDHARHFDQATVLVGNVAEELHISVKHAGSKKHGISPNVLHFMQFDLPDSTIHTTIDFSGNAELYGVLLDGKKGVSVDNIPMRGGTGLVFRAMNAATLSTFCSKKNVQLIILQFGGNAMPYIKSQTAVVKYADNIKNQIVHLQKQVPTAKILFIGPSDMATRVDDKLQTYPLLPILVDELKASAAECGAAYWDLYSAMGGHNSMLAWANANPRLAASDHVHFTRLGAIRIGELLHKSLMMYYDYYKFRTSDDTYTLSVDSIQKAS